MQRLVVIGTGTGIGKTTFSVALLHALRRADPEAAVLGVKPIETGVTPAAETDAAALERASYGLAPPSPHPLFSYVEPLSPHLAARRESARAPDPEKVREWLEHHQAALHVASQHAWLIVETAGAVLSPLAKGVTNFDLLRVLEPAICVLVAPDCLGTLHDTTATLEALSRRGRSPDYVVLSACRVDSSTGTNADEMRLLGIANPIAVLNRSGGGLDGFASELVRARGVAQ